MKTENSIEKNFFIERIEKEKYLIYNVERHIQVIIKFLLAKGINIIGWERFDNKSNCFRIGYFI